MQVVISTDKNILDIDFIHQFLTSSYWAKGRSKDEVAVSIENSMCFGIYVDQKQIGFARVLTDYVVFGYLMDVFITEKHRGKGYAKLLMKAILEHPNLQNIDRWMLATKDAHTLYRQFGFQAIPDPSKLMGKLNTR